MLTYNKLKFAVCINSDDPDLLTPRMLYQVLSDNNAARADYVRVIDNEGEDYLYPADYFIMIDFPIPEENRLSQILSRSADI